ncbi:MAG: aryl-sulfate sulfotransferase [Pirellulales bacterium]|nr:aryl-sulfate sulfotransferase [Pirellulales bacterium]
MSCATLVFFGGMAVGAYKFFPYGYIKQACSGFDYFRSKVDTIDQKLPSLYYWSSQYPDRPPIFNTGRGYPGINLVTGIRGERMLFARIIDMDGNTLHEWDLDWFRVWPNATHLSGRRTPVLRPGTHVHGAVVMENGDLIFNYEHIGLVRIAPDGNVVWRLPYQTHHSIHRHNDGNLWVCGQKEHVERNERFPNRIPPFDEYTILEVSPGGKILREWSVQELLEKNGYDGLCYLGKTESACIAVRDDLLHLNDAEPFPDAMEEAFFNRGDVLVSLRNVNTIFVFNCETDKIKHIATGRSVWQHDPDFIDGNRFSVFDNYAVKTQKFKRFSRITIFSAAGGNPQVYYQGSDDRPFYSDIMGKHQWLPNGNLLITESRHARAFELDPEKKIVWEYIHQLNDGMCGLIEEVQRLPLEYARLYDGSGSDRPQPRRRVSLKQTRRSVQ